MGRPRKAVEVIWAEGKTHMSKEDYERRKAQEVALIDDDLQPPEYLPVRLKRRFEWYVQQLDKLNIIGNVDAELLARYVASEEQYQAVAKKLLKLDPVNDNDLYTKLASTQNKLFTQCRQAGNDLGLSITARGKLVLPVPDEKDKAPETVEDALFGDAL